VVGLQRWLLGIDPEDLKAQSKELSILKAEVKMKEKF